MSRPKLPQCPTTESSIRPENLRSSSALFLPQDLNSQIKTFNRCSTPREDKACSSASHPPWVPGSNSSKVHSAILHSQRSRRRGWTSHVCWLVMKLAGFTFMQITPFWQRFGMNWVGGARWVNQPHDKCVLMTYGSLGFQESCQTTKWEETAKGEK